MSPQPEGEGPPKNRRTRGTRGQRNRNTRNSSHPQRPNAAHSQSEPIQEVILADEQALNDLSRQVLPENVYRTRQKTSSPVTRTKAQKNTDVEESSNASIQNQNTVPPEGESLHNETLTNGNIQAQPITPPRSKGRKPRNASNGQDPYCANSKGPPRHNGKSESKSVRATRSQNTNNTAGASTRPVQPNGLGAFGDTPVKLYAGPDFHASPAPSSIPIPKFLSRSVPNVNKTTSSNDLLDREFQGTSTSEDSLTPEAATPTPHDHRQAREESPLDVLFRTDREARARSSQARPSILSTDRKTSSPNLTQSIESPLRSRTNRHHVRHNTDSSSNGVFPLEMEPMASESSSPHVMKNRTNNAVQDDTRYVDPLEEKSLALKKLLNFSEQMPKLSPSGGSTHSLPNPSTPSPKPTSQGRSSARLSGTPPLFPAGLEGTTLEQRQAALVASLEKQRSSMPPYTSSQRPPSSSLRQELKMPDYAGTFQSEQQPSTPTASRKAERKESWPRNQRAPATTGHIDTIPTTNSGNAQSSFASQTRDREADMKMMEDGLRRILKLDALSGGGTGGGTRS